eukprot:10391806-Lingulodinium_polyedra.AAC.1
MTDGEKQQMENWEATKLAAWAKSVLQYDLTRSWRFTLGIFIGDSGSVNYTKKAPSMVTMVKDSLRQHQIQSVVTTGDTVIEFVGRLKSKINGMAMSCQLAQLEVRGQRPAGCARPCG